VFCRSLASIISLVILALGVVVADVFVLEKTPAQTSYLTIVRLKGRVASGEDGWYIYEVRNADGTVHDAQLPWTAEPGDRVRMRSGRKRILHLPVPTEQPVLCSPLPAIHAGVLGSARPRATGAHS
jgi:hypothetical protein